MVFLEKVLIVKADRNFFILISFINIYLKLQANAKT